MRKDENGINRLSVSDEKLINELAQAYQALGFDGLWHHLDGLKAIDASSFQSIEDDVWRALIASILDIIVNEQNAHIDSNGFCEDSAFALTYIIELLAGFGINL